MKLTSDNVKAGIMILGAIGAVYVVYKAKKEATEIITIKLNPASSGNLIYQHTPQAVKNGFMKFYEMIGL